MNEMRLGNPWTILLGLALPLFGCGDGSGLGTAPQDLGVDSMEIMPGGIGVALLASTFEGGHQNATILIGFEEYALSSYQGELSFDAGVFEVVEVRAPTSDFHIVNDQKLATGHMRFAGFATDGFKQAVEIRLRFATDRPITADDYELSLSVVGSKAGERLPEQRILVYRKLFDEPVR
jgi:hypothetical protein